MAIENNLLHFETEETFQSERNNIKEQSITFVQDSKKIYTHGKEYSMVNWGELKPVEQKAGDICLVNNSTLEKLIIPADSYTLEKYPADSFTPIGVVVVPNTHTDDGTARIISLKSMDYNNPDNGNESDNINIGWGGYGSDIPNLSYKTMYPCIAENYRVIEGEQQIVSWDELLNRDDYLPSDYHDTYPNPYDEGTFYNIGPTSITTHRANPSPYLTGGLKNEIYHSTENSGNILADMDGRVNTAMILAVDNRASTDWQTATAILNEGRTETIHPAVQCTWRYHTVGTNQGDWYLPSAGELGYLVARYKTVEASFTKIRNAGFIVVSLDDSYLSSTVGYNNYVVSIDFYKDYTYFFYDYKYSEHYVRAFLAV